MGTGKFLAAKTRSLIKEGFAEGLQGYGSLQRDKKTRDERIRRIRQVFYPSRRHVRGKGCKNPKQEDLNPRSCGGVSICLNKRSQSSRRDLKSLCHQPVLGSIGGRVGLFGGVNTGDGSQPGRVVKNLNHL